VFEKPICSSMIRSLSKDSVKENHFKNIVEVGRQAESLLILHSLGVAKRL
jgi:hypothetical protein